MTCKAENRPVLVISAAEPLLSSRLGADGGGTAGRARRTAPLA